MLRARGASFSNHKDAIVKLCRGYVVQLQGKNPFRLSANEIRALIIKSLSDEDAREKILSFREELATSCMEQILQILEGTSPITPTDDISHESRFKLRRILVRLSKTSARIPDSLFLTNIENPGTHAVAGGGYADVFRAALKTTPVALKKLRTFQRSAVTRDVYEDLCRESLLWQQLKHPFILPFLGVDRESFKPYYCLVTPWMSSGNIVHYISKELTNKQSEALPVARWYSEIIEGLHYLHQEHVIHGDLRGANIMIGSDRSVRLADFGMSQFADSTSSSLGSHCTGAVRWTAPEVLRGDKLSYENDVYMFGCLWVEIFTRRRPFYDIPHDFQVIAKKLQNIHPSWPPTTSHPKILICPADWQFITSCWDADPSRRPTVTALLELCQLQYHKSLLAPNKVEPIDPPKLKRERNTISSDIFSPISYRSSPGSSLSVFRLAEGTNLASVPTSILNSSDSSPFSIVSNALSNPHTISPRDDYVLVA